MGAGSAVQHRGEIAHRFPAFAAAYEKKKRAQNVVDYDDLLELWLQHHVDTRRPA